ncbi:MAG: YfhO family protein, partial [Desulfosudaceae bacterium]
TDPAFDPRAEVILEEDPDLPESAGTSSGSLKYKRRVNIVSSSTDSLVMEVETPRPAILVVTDAYSRGWRAESAGEEKTREYRVMPADYALRGIPVPAGRHEIRLFYRPALISAGMMISIGGWGVFLLWLIWYGAGRRRSER